MTDTPRKNAPAREKILEKAHELVMERGFAGTSVDMILEAAGLTKGAFFYHFKSKTDLAAALAKRYVSQDTNFFYNIMLKVEPLAADPLERMIRFLDLAADTLEQRDKLPGCLFASYVYDICSPEMAQFMTEQTQKWRRFHARLLRQISERYPPAIDFDPDQLADQYIATIQGGYVLSRIYRDPKQIAHNLRHYRQYLELIFSPGEPGRGAAASTGLAAAT